MPLVIYGLRSIHTHPHVDAYLHESDFKKPGTLQPATGVAGACLV